MQRLSVRIGRHRECQGLLVRDIDNTYLAFEPHDNESMARLAPLIPEPRVNLIRCRWRGSRRRQAPFSAPSSRFSVASLLGFLEKSS